MIFAYIDDADGERVVVIKSLPAVLGRSATCDVRIAGDAVSPRHARLEWAEDGPRLVDLNSLNGVNRAGKRDALIAIGAGVTVRLGEASIELTPTERLPATRSLARRSSATTPLRRVAFGALALVGCYGALLGGLALQQYARYWPPERSIDMFGSALWFWLIVLLISTFLGLFSKVQTGQFRFLRFAVALTSLFVMVYVLGQLMDTVVYNARVDVLRVVVEHVLALAVLTLGLWGLTKTLYPAWRRRRQVFVALGLSLFMDAVASAYEFYEYRQGDRQEHDEAVAWPIVSPTIGAASMAALQDRVTESVGVIDGYRTERQAELKAEEGTGAAHENH